MAYDAKLEATILDTELLEDSENPIAPIDGAFLEVRQYGDRPERLAILKSDNFPANSIPLTLVSSAMIDNWIGFLTAVRDNMILPREQEKARAAKQAASKRDNVARRRGGKTSILKRFGKAEAEAEAIAPFDGKTKGQMADWLLSDPILTALDDAEANAADAIRTAVEEDPTKAELKEMVEIVSEVLELS